MISVFGFSSYREYLLAVESEAPRNGFGFRSRVAKVSQCQNAYVSRVFSGKADFSLDQAFAVATMIGLSGPALEYFELLVHLERAGTQALRTHLSQKMRQLRERETSVGSRVPSTMPLDPVAEARYFSDWIYAAVHAAVSVPGIQTAHQLAKEFEISEARVTEVLDFLKKVGLVSNDKGLWKVGKNRIHLKNDSPWILPHHRNWRLKALELMQRKNLNSIHYTGIATVSESTFYQIKELLLQSIEETNKKIAESKDAMVVSFNLDFDQITKFQGKT
jgi:uncharacterized protein (TIGR02147 family)